jgi:hypothetical protein
MVRTLLLGASLSLALPLAAHGEEPAAVALPSSTSFAQGTKSLSFGLPNSSTAAIGLGYFLQTDGELRLDVFFEFVFSRPVGNSSQDFGASVAYRAYFHRIGQVAPFLEPSFSVARVSPALATGSYSASLGFGVAFGAEYLFASQFSVGGKIGIAFDLTNLDGTGNVGSSLSTATSQLFAKAYF